MNTRLQGDEPITDGFVRFHSEHDTDTSAQAHGAETGTAQTEAETEGIVETETYTPAPASLIALPAPPTGTMYVLVPAQAQLLMHNNNNTSSIPMAVLAPNTYMPPYTPPPQYQPSGNDHINNKNNNNNNNNQPVNVNVNAYENGDANDGDLIECTRSCVAVHTIKYGRIHILIMILFLLLSIVFGIITVSHPSGYTGRMYVYNEQRGMLFGTIVIGAFFTEQDGLIRSATPWSSNYAGCKFYQAVGNRSFELFNQFDCDRFRASIILIFISMAVSIILIFILFRMLCSKTRTPSQSQSQSQLQQQARVSQSIPRFTWCPIITTLLSCTLSITSYALLDHLLSNDLGRYLFRRAGYIHHGVMMAMSIIATGWIMIFVYIQTWYIKQQRRQAQQQQLYHVSGVGLTLAPPSYQPPREI